MLLELWWSQCVSKDEFTDSLVAKRLRAHIYMNEYLELCVVGAIEGYMTGDFDLELSQGNGAVRAFVLLDAPCAALIAVSSSAPAWSPIKVWRGIRRPSHQNWGTCCSHHRVVTTPDHLHQLYVFPSPASTKQSGIGLVDVCTV